MLLVSYKVVFIKNEAVLLCVTKTELELVQQHLHLQSSV